MELKAEHEIIFALFCAHMKNTMNMQTESHCQQQDSTGNQVHTGVKYMKLQRPNNSTLHPGHMNSTPFFLPLLSAPKLSQTGPQYQAVYDRRSSSCSHSFSLYTSQQFSCSLALKACVSLGLFAPHSKVH